jgi:hypothetical protein
MLSGDLTVGESVRKSFPSAFLASVIFIACVFPWGYRNWQVFHAFIPMRGNFGAELYSSLLEGNNGFEWGPTIPLTIQDPKYQEYKSLGEVAFVRKEIRQAQEYIARHKVRFLELAVKRFYFFWVSTPHVGTSRFQEYVRVETFCFSSLSGILGLILAIRNRVPGSGLLASAFILLPLTYYFVIAAARFRHPLEPLITIFAVYLFQSASSSRMSLPRQATTAFSRVEVPNG